MSSDLVHILKLLDDPEPAVQSAVATYVEQFQGDMSEELASEALSLTQAESKILSKHLMPGRRQYLMDNWQVPRRFLQNDSQDWETFEYLLSLLSDYLHDGVSLRTSLSDALDLLADEIHLAEASSTPDLLAQYLFKDARLTGNKQTYFALENSDLTWVLNNGIGNPITLVVIYMLLSNRFGLSVYGCNYPGHFLAWVPSAKGPYAIDAYNNARVLWPQEIIRENPLLSQQAKTALSGPCPFFAIIIRVLNNIETSLQKEGLDSEIPCIQQLKRSITPTPVS